ncbi:MAG: class I SAM-dependent methyltransferase [Sedimentisphaerales bacterium]|nr:class I SAM-dependent methyltransferase [Sedimentisphaerales bacterium]
MSDDKYVHGYSEREAQRLGDQANTLSELLHHDTVFTPGSRVLEAGCGVGAQTVIVAPKNPDCSFVSVDLSAESLAQAQAAARQKGIDNVTFQQGDIFALPFAEGSFDHVFVCFVLEHLSEPARALQCLKRLIKPGGTITCIEGDHGSWYCYPPSEYADRAVDCLVQIQARLGGDSLIGRQLYPLLTQAEFGLVPIQA